MKTNQIMADSSSFSREYKGFCCCQNFFLLFKYFKPSSAVFRIIFWALSLRTPRLLCNSLGSLSNCVKYSYSGRKCRGESLPHILRKKKIPDHQTIFQARLYLLYEAWSQFSSLTRKDLKCQHLLIWKSQSLQNPHCFPEFSSEIVFL